MDSLAERQLKQLLLVQRHFGAVHHDAPALWQQQQQHETASQQQGQLHIATETPARSCQMLPGMATHLGTPPQQHQWQSPAMANPGNKYQPLSRMAVPPGASQQHWLQSEAIPAPADSQQPVPSMGMPLGFPPQQHRLQSAAIAGPARSRQPLPSMGVPLGTPPQQHWQHKAANAAPAGGSLSPQRQASSEHPQVASRKHGGPAVNPAQGMAVTSGALSSICQQQGAAAADNSMLGGASQHQDQEMSELGGSPKYESFLVRRAEPDSSLAVSGSDCSPIGHLSEGPSVLPETSQLNQSSCFGPLAAALTPSLAARMEEDLKQVADEANEILDASSHHDAYCDHGVRNVVSVRVTAGENLWGFARRLKDLAETLGLAVAKRAMNEEEVMDLTWAVCFGFVFTVPQKARALSLFTPSGLQQVLGETHPVTAEVLNDSWAEKRNAVQAISPMIMPGLRAMRSWFVEEGIVPCITQRLMELKEVANDRELNGLLAPSSKRVKKRPDDEVINPLDPDAGVEVELATVAKRRRVQHDAPESATQDDLPDGVTQAQYSKIVEALEGMLKDHVGADDIDVSYGKFNIDGRRIAKILKHISENDHKSLQPWRLKKKGSAKTSPWILSCR